MLISAFNPPLDNLELTYLSASEAAGVTTHAVKNTNLFTANDRILLGQQGREKAEIVTLTSVTDARNLVTGATSFAHEADDPITRLRYDQVKIYRSTTGSSGTYSLLTTIAVDVDNAELMTHYDDTTALSTYYYKVSFYNSVSAVESSQSDAIAATGYGHNTVGSVIDEFLTNINDPTENTITRNEILSLLNDCSDDLTSNVSRPYGFLHTRTTLSRTANLNYIDFPVDSVGRQSMWKFDRMDYVFVDTSVTPNTSITYTLRVIEPEHFRFKYENNTIDSTTVDDNTQLMALDTSANRFRFAPPWETTSTGVFYLHYWKYFTILDSAGDYFETPTPLPYKYYLLYRYYLKKSHTDSFQGTLANNYQGLYQRAKTDLQKANRKDVGSPRSFSFQPQTYKGWRQN